MDSIKLNKIIVEGDLAHFKIPLTSKIHRTYKIAPISTVVGILKNVYGEDIDDFIFGSVTEYDDIHKEINKVYKEFNLKKESETNSKRFLTDIIQIEYLVNPRVVIYTNLDGTLKLGQVLNLGKTDCLGKIKIEEITLYKQNNIGFNQYTPIHIGNGLIKKINTLTDYKINKGCFDYKSEVLRENTEFESIAYWDEIEQNNIMLWTFNGGEINEFK